MTHRSRLHLSITLPAMSSLLHAHPELAPCFPLASSIAGWAWSV